MAFSYFFSLKNSFPSSFRLIACSLEKEENKRFIFMYYPCSVWWCVHPPSGGLSSSWMIACIQASSGYFWESISSGADFMKMGILSNSYRPEKHMNHFGWAPTELPVSFIELNIEANNSRLRQKNTLWTTAMRIFLTSSQLFSLNAFLYLWLLNLSINSSMPSSLSCWAAGDAILDLNIYLITVLFRNLL